MHALQDLELKTYVWWRLIFPLEDWQYSQKWWQKLGKEINTDIFNNLSLYFFIYSG